ncbi:MAG: NUDIX hydrolase [Leptospiraceae bacterium]|nr:NUDIX hydrolase [Leptospiraceae bacterium]
MSSSALSETRYRNPVPTVDLIIRVPEGIVLIERKNEPHGFALPGGFVDEGESVEQAAIREAKEETSLDVRLEELFYVYSDPARDPRKHTISIVFLASARGKPLAGDDAKSVLVVSEESIASGNFGTADATDTLVFDHHRILQDYSRYRKEGHRPLHI